MTNDIQLTEWYLVRHAPVKKSLKGIYKNADAEAELPSRTTIQFLAKQLPDNADWFVSPMRRTKATAQALLDEKNNNENNFTLCSQITEQDFGAWQGLAFEEIWQQVKDLEAHNWALMTAKTTPPNGESFNDVTKRVTNFIDTAVKQNTGKPKVLVTHAGVIRAFVGTVLGMNADSAMALNAEPFSLTRLLHQTGTGKGGQWQLQTLNHPFL